MSFPATQLRSWRKLPGRKRTTRGSGGGREGRPPDPSRQVRVLQGMQRPQISVATTTRREGSEAEERKRAGRNRALASDYGLGATHPDDEIGILKKALDKVREEVGPSGVPIPHIPELDGPVRAAA